MLKSPALIIGCACIIFSCNTPAQTDSKQTDSAATAGQQKDSAEHVPKQNLDSAGNKVKAESPDALVEYEQGYALPRTNDGQAQSPVNIISTNSKADTRKKDVVKYTGRIVAVENLGHTIQVDFAKGSMAKINSDTYDLKQLHFHSPSEHLIDGITYPLEMHIVSQLPDSVKNGASKYTVLGILFKIGRENKFLKEFLNSIPSEEGKNILDTSKVILADLFTGTANPASMSYYNYQGSLTTPPYTESVNWLVSKNIFEASEEQIEKITKLEGNNARHVHALNNRQVRSE